MGVGRQTNSCPIGSCECLIKFENSARPFKKPARIVPLAIQKGILHKSARVLEVGSGSLRNAFYLVEKIGCKVDVYEVETTIERFRRRYEKLQQIGSNVFSGSFPKRKYDFVICTFVLESVCPKSARESLLVMIENVLTKEGKFLLSMRGPKDIKTNWPAIGRGRKCACKDGYITPLRTFIKPYALPDIEALLEKAGFTETQFLHSYRTLRPQIINLMASKAALRPGADGQFGRRPSPAAARAGGSKRDWKKPA
ncbi:class I SAM-dependent methyltransferase [Acidobacteriia bacterium AH_259_A11_L15]|nr:class I SAM-dependent methyltransferase [Acidobacteriia bacterium AH_259_A11_L15]